MPGPTALAFSSGDELEPQREGAADQERLDPALDPAEPDPEVLVARHVAAGELVVLLDDWSPAFAGYYLYYPSRRQMLPAFRVVIDALRHGAA